MDDTSTSAWHEEQAGKLRKDLEFRAVWTEDYARVLHAIETHTRIARDIRAEDKK